MRCADITTIIELLLSIYFVAYRCLFNKLVLFWGPYPIFTGAKNQEIGISGQLDTGPLILDTACAKYSMIQSYSPDGADNQCSSSGGERASMTLGRVQSSLMFSCCIFQPPEALSHERSTLLLLRTNRPNDNQRKLPSVEVGPTALA